jgi:lipoprotein-releasing system permease protein
MYKIILPFRYCIKKPITAAAVAAVTLCVFIVIVVMTVMTGLVNNFKDKNYRFVGDCVIVSDSLVGFAYYEDLLSRLNGQEFVAAATPVVKGFGLLTQPNADWNVGIEIMGIEPRSYSAVTAFADGLHYHRLDSENAFVPLNNTEKTGCVAGIDLAPMPWRRDAQGQYNHSEMPPRFELVISSFPLTAKGALASADTNPASTMNFYYSDDCQTGLVRIDERMVYISLADAQKLCGMDSAEKRISAIHIKFTDDTSLQDGLANVNRIWRQFYGESASQKHANLLDNVSVQSWLSYRRTSIAAMEKEQTMMTFVFIMLAFITVFIILVIFYMIISHKSRDIGILRAVGVSRVSVAAIFLVFAGLIGSSGAVLGTAGALGFLWKLNAIEDMLFARFGWQLFDKSVYAIGYLPSQINTTLIAVVIVSAIVVSMAGAMLPTIQAARRRPVETLQVNQL